MSFKNVILVKQTYKDSPSRSDFLPTGLGYISEALERADISSNIIDMGLDCREHDVVDYLAYNKPDLIGISIMSYRHKDTYRLIEQMKKALPSCAIVVGGPHVSALRDKVLEGCPAIDYGITLEGEETIVELCCGDHPLDQIKGLLYRNSNGKICYTGNRDFIRDLDGNGFPRYTHFELAKYPSGITLITSRSCPFHCIYCQVPLINGQQVRFRSVRSVVDELEYWYWNGYYQFEIADDNFTLRASRVMEICDEIEKRKLKNLKIACGNGVRADKVNREILKRMREVGFYCIGFGVEASNNRILQNLKKGETIEQIERAISDACDLGYQVKLFFLLGSPGETEKDVWDSVRLALRYPIYYAYFNNLIPYPNTELYDWALENNYLLTNWDVYLNETAHKTSKGYTLPLFETPELSLQRRKRLWRRANKKMARHSCKAKKKVHYEEIANKFKGYGIPNWFCRLLASLYFNFYFYQYVVEKGILGKLRKLLAR